MIHSMTGYGRAETLSGRNKITVEIRSVNGKGTDISIKTQLIPRDKEIEVKQLISSLLRRGSIDIFATAEPLTGNQGRTINREIFQSYLRQLEEIFSDKEERIDIARSAEIIMRLPDVVENHKKDNDPESDEEWEIIKNTILKAVYILIEFRRTEGKKLEEDIIARVNRIVELTGMTDEFDRQRTDIIRDRLRARIEELSGSVDTNRLEQEIIYYIEKLDITEEKVRLKQHCSYFLETMKEEEPPGKKLGFIAQEMGREINTLGSKASNANIQKLVVEMKDELEKIKEQTLNIL